jgi:hypothetical protein
MPAPPAESKIRLRFDQSRWHEILFRAHQGDLTLQRETILIRKWNIGASFLRLAEMPTFTLDRLCRYEHLLWRQSCQIVCAGIIAATQATAIGHGCTDIPKMSLSAKNGLVHSHKRERLRFAERLFAWAPKSGKIQIFVRIRH